jgi:FG-GAP-like repeat
MRFLGSDFQININSGAGDGVLGNQLHPQVAVLTDGRFAVVYQSDHLGDPTDPDPIAALYNVDGSLSSFNFLDVLNHTGSQSQPTIAGQLPGGSFGVVFTNDRHANGSVDANPGNITYVRVAANGTLGTPLAIGDFGVGNPFFNMLNPAIATLSDGRQVVAFESVFTAGTDDDILLNVVSADGLTTQFNAFGSNPALDTVAFTNAYESTPKVVAIGTNALVAFEDSTGTTISSENISASIFNGTTNTVGARFLVADHAAALFADSVTALDSHRYLIVYEDGTDIFGKIYDTNGGTLSAEIRIDQLGGNDTAAVVAATADGGFIATWFSAPVSSYDIFARRFNSDGVAMGQQFIVNRLTDNSQYQPTVAVSGANAFFAWGDDAARPGDSTPSSVRGQVMTLITPPDFNDNGVSDILWRNASGALAVWDMNKSGAIGSGGFVTSGGVIVAPDASYSVAAISDFSGDGKADVLWRNTSGSLIEWLMNGTVIAQSSYVTASGVPVNPDPSWSFLGAGDFNGDGMSDMLWRNASGEIAEWQMNGTVIAGSGDLNAGAGAIFLGGAWSVAGIGDFNGDGKSDIIWRNASGEVAQWQMNGSSIIGSGDLKAGGVAVMPGASWSVAGVGDFDADGNADLLWRDSGSGALVEWLMNGTSIIGSGSVTSGGTPVNPDPSWHMVEIGDFNGDARADILWRNDNGSMAEWFMKGTAIIGTATPSSGGAAVTPDAGWIVQAKPTDYA